MSAESSLVLKRGRPFQKGQSGNPKGRPKGALNKSTLVAQSLLEGEAEALVRKVVQLALDGDLTCLRICMERLVPKKHDVPIDIDLPEIGTSADIPKLFSAVTARVARGAISPSEAKSLIDLAGVLRRSLEVMELEPRISVLEKTQQR